MRSFFLVFLMTYSLSAVGQNHFLGLKGGINWSNVTSSVLYLSDNNNRIGFSGGLTYEYHLKQHFFIGVDLLYSQKGFTIEKKFPDENGKRGGEIVIIEHYDYLSLPLKGGFIVGKKITGFVILGLVPSHLIDAKIIMPSLYFIGETIDDITDKVTKFDFAGLAEIGGSIKIRD